MSALVDVSTLKCDLEAAAAHACVVVGRDGGARRHRRRDGVTATPSRRLTTVDAKARLGRRVAPNAIASALMASPFVFSSWKSGASTLTFEPRRSRMFLVRAPNRGCGLITSSGTSTEEATGPFLGSSSFDAPSNGKATTVGATSFSLRAISNRARRDRIDDSTLLKSSVYPEYGFSGVDSTIQEPARPLFMRETRRLSHDHEDAIFTKLKFGNVRKRTLSQRRIPDAK